MPCSISATLHPYGSPAPMEIKMAPDKSADKVPPYPITLITFPFASLIFVGTTSMVTGDAVIG